MNTYTIDELDREEIELLPSRVVMTACNNPCYSPCWNPCAPPVQIYVKFQLCGLLRGGVNVG